MNPLDISQITSICGTKKIYPSQVSVAAHILGHQGSVLTPECGGGKTLSIYATAYLLARSQGLKTLVVCKPKIIGEVWATEHKKWTHIDTLKVAILNHKTIKARDKALQKAIDDDSDIYVLSYQTMKWMLKHKAKLPEFTMVVAEEGSIIKKHNSVLRKNLIELSPARKISVISTANPASIDEQDYWGLSQFLDGGKRLGSKIGEFRDRFLRSRTLGAQYNNVTLWEFRNAQAATEVRQRFAELCVSYEVPDDAKIEIESSQWKFKLSDRSKAIYNTLLKEGIAALSKIVGDQPPVGAMAMKMKLGCLTSGFLYTTTIERISRADLMTSASAKQILAKVEKKEAIEVFNDREDAMKELVTHIRKVHGGDCKLLVCYKYTHEKTQLERMFPNAVAGKEFSDDQWNNGEIPIGLLQYQSDSEGRNLQTCEGGNILIHYSRTYSFIEDRQIIRRIARQGQIADKVYQYYLHCENTVDDEKLRAVNKRGRMHQKLVDITPQL